MRRLQNQKKRSNVYSSCGKSLRSARKNADVGNRRANIVWMGKRLETGDVTRAWKPGGKTTTRQMSSQIELSPRQKIMRGRRFCEDLQKADEKGNVFRVANQLVDKNKDVLGSSCKERKAA